MKNFIRILLSSAFLLGVFGCKEAKYNFYVIDGEPAVQSGSDVSDFGKETYIWENFIFPTNSK